MDKMKGVQIHILSSWNMPQDELYSRLDLTLR